MSDLCLPTGKNCPQCGAEFKYSYPGWNVYVCQTIQRMDDGRIKEQEPCLRRQLAQKDARIKQLEAALRRIDVDVNYLKSSRLNLTDRTYLADILGEIGKALQEDEHE